MLHAVQKVNYAPHASSLETTHLVRQVSPVKCQREKPIDLTQYAATTFSFFCVGSTAARSSFSSRARQRKHVVSRCVEQSAQESESTQKEPIDSTKPAAAAAAAAATAATTVPDVAALRNQLLGFAASTDRGQRGNDVLNQRCVDLIGQLERCNPTSEPAQSPLLDGCWRLIYASEDPTRCSPFFWAWRQTLGDVQDPSPISRAVLGTETLVDSIFAITDSVPIKSVGLATQNIDADKLVNQVVVGVFPTGESKMTTTSSIAADPVDGDVLNVTVEKTQVLGASLAASLLDQIEFPSGEALGADNATVKMQITFLDETLRIVRDKNRRSACFVFCRTPE